VTAAADRAVAELAPQTGTRAACAAVGAAPASWYRRHRASPAPPRPPVIPQAQRVQPRALAPPERQAILDVLHSERFTDAAPAGVWATLLDEGTYLGITQPHSRPHVSNDNPFSESQFKTMKYRPHFPGRFTCIEHARAHCQVFPWYNNEHRHSGLGLHTPADIHYGRAGQVQAGRAAVLAAAYTAHSERFVTPPQPPKLPAISWINQPGKKEAATQ